MSKNQNSILERNRPAAIRAYIFMKENRQNKDQETLRYITRML